MTNALSKTYKNMGDTELYKELKKRTGVRLEFIHPPVGQEEENFQMLIASAESIDIYGDFHYYGGTRKAITDGVILPLNAYVEEYAPNLSAILKENPEWGEAIKTDDGLYETFPFLREEPFLCVYAGPMVRKDWLDDLGLEVPRTVAEWENVLLRFKEEKGAEYPFSADKETFRLYEVLAGAYGTANGMFLDDEGRVKFGPVQPEYKQYLETLHRWYTMGLLDRGFVNNDNAAVKVKILKGEVGMTVGTAGKDMGGYISAAKETNAGFNIVPIPYPVLNPGEKAILGQRTPQVEANCFISSHCKKPEIAVKFLDYGYSPEGHMLYNFGIEGVSYTMQDGNPVYTEEIINNPDGLAFDESLVRFARANYHGPFVQDARYIDQFYALQQQKEAVEIWSDTEAQEHILQIDKMTTGENERYTEIFLHIQNYCDEMFYKFVMGQESLERFDDYVDKVYALGCEEAVQIQQEAVDRYRKKQINSAP